MKILMVCGLYYPVIGGAERECQKHAESLTKEGHQVMVLTQWLKGSKEYEIVNGVRVYRAIKGMRPWAIGYLISTLMFMIRHKKEYDLIQCYGIFYHTTASILMKYFFGKKVINRLESSGEKGDLGRIYRIKYGCLVKYSWKRVDKLIAISREIHCNLVQAGVGTTKIVYIPNSVNTDLFKPLDGKTDETLVRILFVGRLVEVKGVDILIRALKKIFREERRNVSLSIVGDGPMRDRLEQIASEISGQVPIQFVGQTPEVLGYYQHSHILVLPSFREGLPLVLLEGMACGLPVVASDIGGHREVIEDGVNGLLFPVGQVDELASRIVYLIENPDRAKKMGLRARQTVLSGFSLAESLKRYLDLYRSLNV